jgi:hypothetical protein
MSIVGTPGSEDRKKFYAGCAFAVLAAAVLYFELRDPSTPTPPPAPVVVTAPNATRGNTSSNDKDTVATPPGNAAGVATAKPSASSTLDPTLHMDAMLVTESVAYEGTGRNIFSAISAPPPVAIVKPIAPARPIQAPAPMPVLQQGPPPPPPIPLKFCGTISSPAKGTKQAILVHEDDVYPAAVGDVVLHRYKLLAIATNSVQVEDLTNNNKQTLPLLAN